MHGHDVGDLLLIELDENITESTELVNNIAEKVCATLAKHYILSVQHDWEAKVSIEHHCTSSIGVVLFIYHEASEENILK
jgi:GGDEF domain-containing protein